MPPSAPTPPGQLVRVAETGRRPLTLVVDGAPITALAGDTVLTALLASGHRLRTSEFGDGPRAGFCLIGACQDCWVAFGDSGRGRACTTLAEDGMRVATRPADPA